jgi:VanZ family protein
MKSKNLHVGFTPLLAWSAAIFVFSSLPAYSYPAVGVEGADKMVHVILYAIWAALCALGWVSTSTGARTAPAIIAIGSAALATAYGITDELHQLFVPTRSADWRDVVGDAVGGVIGGAIAVAILRKRRRPL